jgi:membrane protease YdiL (CAAX protease family)
MKNPFFEHTGAPVKIIFFLFIILGSFILFLSLGIFLSIPLFQADLSNFTELFDFSKSENIGFLKFMQAVQHIGIYLAPPIFAAILYSRFPKKYLYTTQKSPWYLFVLLIFIAFLSIPLTGYLGNLNSSLSFPASLSGFEEKIRAMETQASEITKLFLNVSAVSGLAVNLFVIAVLPAIGEELFFRGILQKLFTQWTKNVHVSVFITAVLFSAVHMQFFTFLPRFFMGVLFGYLLVWSKNIWMPVLAHFINNATAVIVYFFSENNEIIEQTDLLSSQIVLVILFFILFSTAIYYFYQYSRENKAILDFE